MPHCPIITRLSQTPLRVLRARAGARAGARLQGLPLLFTQVFYIAHGRVDL